jgi:hypothetical protein
LAKVRRIQQALVDWVKATAPKLRARCYADYRKTPVGPATVPDVPFPIAPHRFEPALVPGHHFQLTHLVKNGEPQRNDRIRGAVERKFPKLAARKRDANARTILVLEDNDIQLTDQAIVTETYLPLLMGRTDRPDETYLVASCIRRCRRGSASQEDVDGREHLSPRKNFACPGSVTIRMERPLISQAKCPEFGALRGDR